MTVARLLGLGTLALMLSACSSSPAIPVAERVDLERFMGDWYVIANIPTSMEKGAHNAVESYRRTPTAASPPPSPIATARSTVPRR